MEIWKDIKNYEGYYQVSSLGNVKSLSRYYTIINRWGHSKNIFMNDKLLKPEVTNKGYYRVTLSKEHNTKRISLHRLVLEAFVPNVEDCPQINHKNGIKSDNSVDNLEWCTHSYNQLHAYRTGLNTPTAEQRKTSKKIIFMNAAGEITEYPSICNAAKNLSLKRDTIRNSINEDRKILKGIYKDCKFLLK